MTELSSSAPGTRRSSAAPTPVTALDIERLREALVLAESGFGRTEPNPRVGCIIGLADGTVLGRGATQQAGHAHAEIMALRDAHALGRVVRGATAWVTLEPCAHHGRTPPCCDALIAAGLARVVLAASDPFSAVNGQGTARLRAAGIAVVDIGDSAAAGSDPALHDIRTAAREINVGFFSRIERGRPWVRMKIAASLDGRTGLDNGVSQWITGEAARADGHAWRRRASAVLTGIGTVLEDNPRLDVRLVPTVLQPLRVVVDSRMQTPPAAQLLARPGRGVWIYAAEDRPQQRQALEAAGAALRLLPGVGDKVDLVALMADLGARDINELHVEAGHKLNGSLLRAGLVDELLLYLAPRLIGPGRDLAALPALQALSGTLDFHFEEAKMVGGDLRIRARRADRSD